MGRVVFAAAAACITIGAGILNAGAQQAPPLSDFDIQRLAKRCEGQREEAITSIYGLQATAEQGAALDQKLGATAIANADAQQIEATLSVPINRDGKSKPQVAGELYENCLYLERLRELDSRAAGAVERAAAGGSGAGAGGSGSTASISSPPPPDIFSTLPRREGGDVTTLLAGSTDDKTREARIRQTNADIKQQIANRQAASDAFWNGLLSITTTAAQVYADGRLDTNDTSIITSALTGESVASGGSSGGYSGGGYASGGGQSSGGGGSTSGGVGSGTDRCGGAGPGQGLPAFNAAFGAMSQQQYPMNPNYGAQQTYQWTYFVMSNGLDLIEDFKGCLSPADYQTNRKALIDARNSGKQGCEQLSSVGGECPRRYPG